MGYLIKQSSTARALLFLMVDSTDHVTGKTGLSPTVTIRKEGGSFASPSGAVTEIANGWYQVAGNATDSNTLGSLILHATGTGADPVDDRYEVVKFDPDDSVRLGLTALPNAAADAAGGLPISDAGGLDLDTRLGYLTAAAATAAALATAQADLDTLTGTDGATLATSQPNYAPATASALSTVSGKVDTAQADLDILTGTDGATLATSQPNYAPATAAALSTVSGKVDTAQADLDVLTGTDGATLATSQPNYAPATAAALATAQTDLDTLTGADGATLATSQPNYAPATAAALTTVDTVVDAIKVVTDALGASAATLLAKSAGSMVAGTVDTATNSHTPTTTEFQADDITEATADHFNGRIVIFLTGALASQATDITDYSNVGGIGQFTVTAMTEAPANNDTFIIV